MHLTLDEAKFWSTLDPRPTIFYDRKNDAYLACWGGWSMTHAQALVIASAMFFNVWPTPKMKEAMFNEFRRLHYSNAFGVEFPGIETQTAGAHFALLYKNMLGLAKDKLKDKYKDSPAEVLKWFDKRSVT